MSGELASVVNEILSNHNIELTLEPFDLCVDPKNGTVIWNIQGIENPRKEDKISSYLKKTTFKQIDISSRILYHYLPKGDYHKAIMDTQCIRLYNLNKYLKGDGDKSEYRLFLEKFGISFPNFEKQINDIKDDIFIWCLTDSKDSEKHWEKFADDGKGIVIAIQFKSTKPLSNTVGISDVRYNLEFLEEVQSTLKEKYGLLLEISGFPLFAKYFKPKCLDWERETRLSFDNNFWHYAKFMHDQFKYENPQRASTGNLFSVQVDGDEKYIQVPMKNDFFELEIIGVYDKEQAFA